MKAQAVKTKEGWYLQNLPGFDDIRSETVEIDVTLSAAEIACHDYKELRGIAFMERHVEKEAKSASFLRDRLF